MTYARRQRFAGDCDGTVWDADTGALEGRYKGVVGSATAQQVIRKNSEAWRSFFSLNEKYHDPNDERVTEKPSPPGYWGNEDDGRELRTYIRKDCYTLEWGERSRLEAESEAWTSQACPQCGSTAQTTRHRDTLTCPCGFEGHADLTASETFLQENSDTEVRPMARPVRLKWDNHEWRPDHRSPPAGTTTNEERTNQSTQTGDLATVESA